MKTQKRREEIICYDGINYNIINFSFKSLKVELDHLFLNGFVYYGLATVPEMEFRHCYSFLLLINNEKSRSVWTNRKRIAEQILNYLKNRRNEKND